MAQEQRRPVRYHRREPAPEQPAVPVAPEPAKVQRRAPEQKAEESPDGD